MQKNKVPAEEMTKRILKLAGEERWEIRELMIALGSCLAESAVVAKLSLPYFEKILNSIKETYQDYLEKNENT